MKSIYSLLFISFLISNVVAQKYEVKRDDFNGNHRSWPAGNTDTYYSEMVNGEYIIQNKKEKGGFEFNTTWRIDPTKDFRIKTSLAFLSGLDNHGYGIYWSNPAVKKSYYFIITSNGYYQVGGWDHGGGYFEEQTWTTVELNGTGEYNELEVSKKGSTMYFYLNHKRVFSTTNIALGDTRFGVHIFSGMKIKADYFEVAGYFEQINLATDIPKGLTLENLGSKVNTDHDELATVIAHDGTRIFFERQKDEKGYGKTDAYVAYRSAENQWDRVENMGKPINNAGHNFIISESPDGNTLLVGNTYHEDGSANTSGVSITHRTESGWEIPTEQHIENYYNRNKYVEYCLAPNQQVLIMAVERDDSEGDKDLYYSERVGTDSWSEPKHMGAVINTKGNEVGPFLAADGRTLYFASDGHMGYGSSDIFVSKRIGSGWTNWTTPKNLGPDINSTSWEAYFTMDLFGEFAYVVSDRNKKNGADIFQIRLKEKEVIVLDEEREKSFDEILEEETKKEFDHSSISPDPVVIIRGKVFDAITNKPLSTTIQYEDLDRHDKVGQARANPVTGEYQIILPYGLHYGFYAEASKHYPINDNLDIKEAGKTVIEIERDLYLMPWQVGKSIRLNNIFFVRSKPELLSKSYPELERLVEMMENNPKMTIQIEGHTDGLGNPVDLMKLSWDRAKAVRKFLVEKGIAKGRITEKGFGRSKPIATNDTEAHRARNRRVEFKILNLD